MKRINFIFILLSSLIFSSCASSSFTYNPPSLMPKIQKSIIVKKSKEIVWNTLVRGISETIFVINNLDKQSGFINASYSGDPEKFVEGGILNFTFSNLRGEVHYSFPASRASTQYSTMAGGIMYNVYRKLSLDGRMNILVSEIDSVQTSVTVNIKYILNLENTYVLATGNSSTPFQETISFNTGQSARASAGTEYYANGELEKLILALF